MNCMKCREYNELEGEYRYHQARKTEWRPPPGMDPRLREYKYKCGNVVYQSLTDAQLERERLHVPVVAGKNA